MTGFIYLICTEDGSGYKIGRSQDVNKRLQQLQTGCDSRLEVLYTYPTRFSVELEFVLHKRFLDKQKINEWFELDEDDVVSFITTCKKYEDNFKTLKDNGFFSKSR